MRIQHLLEFTEHHRFYCYRNFSLGSIDYRMLSFIYKPLVGAFAISLYEQLCVSVVDGKTGYSTVEPHRKLLLSLGLTLNENSRGYLIEQLSKLEAIGLLQTSRIMPGEQSDYLYEYELIAPLLPSDFFENIHFTMLLRDKLGKYAVIDIREQLYAAEPSELLGQQGVKENISIPFYEIFKLNANIVDEELEQALQEVAPTREVTTTNVIASAGFTYGDIMSFFPKQSNNLYYVEQLRTHPELLAQINYIAYKYGLSLVNLRRLLDEEGVFEVNGELDIDQLQRLANQFFRQDKKNEEDRQRVLSRTALFQQELQQEKQGEVELDEPEHDVEEAFYLPVPKLLADFCDIHQYNALMRNEPHIQFLKRYFPGQVPDWILNALERIDLHYKLAAPVINVLIHYGIGMNDQGRITKAYLDSIASNMLMKGIDTYEKAVQYVRAQEQLELDIERRKEGAYSSASSKGTSKGNAKTSSYYNRNRNQGRQKPVIPTISNEQLAAARISAEELEELRKLAQKFDQQT